MSVQFSPCPGCSRHVKRTDAACPFCGASASSDVGPTRTLAGRLSRAALFAAGAMGIAVTTVDCSSISPQPLYGGSAQPLYGGVSPATIQDSSTRDGLSAEEDASEEATSLLDSPSGSDAPGAQDGPVDAADASTTGTTDASDGSMDAPSADDVPSVVALYGSPMPAYGTPPFPRDG
jgi:hypothetical protein